MGLVKIKNTNNKGYTLIELVIIVVILGVLVLIAVPLYNDHIEKVTRQVCITNCQQLEQMYQVYLVKENKDHTIYEFDTFLQEYNKVICPANGDIVYVRGVVKCILHSKDETDGYDDDDIEEVPFL